MLVQCLLRHGDRSKVTWVEADKTLKKGSVILLKGDTRGWVVMEVYYYPELINLNSDWEVGGLGKRPKK